MNCIICGIELEGKREGAQYCSPKCRKIAYRKRSIAPTPGTDNVTLSQPRGTDNLLFEFYTISKANGTGRPTNEKSPIRKAKYWYDVPLAAIPIIQKEWPKMPDFMNGRQYFLWWKNEFEVNQDLEEGEVGTPIILNPYPTTEGATYFQAGEGSRRWGA